MTEPEKAHGASPPSSSRPTSPALRAARPSPSWASAPPPPARSSSTTTECPVENRLGEEGEGFKIAMAVLDAGRIGIAAQALGIAEAAYEASVNYAREREAFGADDRRVPGDPVEDRRYEDPHRGRAPADLQRGAGQDSAARRRRALHAGGQHGQAVCLRDGHVRARTRPCRSTAAWATARSCRVERYFRDAKITEIYEGTSEIQRMVIARSLTGLR